MKIIFLLCSFLILAGSISCSAQPHTAPSIQTSEEASSLPSVDIEQINNLFELETYYQRFSGTVHVKHRGAIVLQQAYGGVPRGVLSGIDTRFDIGSISKSFTAAAILSLAHAGKLNLQDKINVHLGDLQSDHWEKVTIHQVLTHTSGIPSIYQTEQGLPIFLPEKEPIAINDLIDKFRNGKLIFKPGSDFSYSNSGYVLLAAIIEKVSNMPFERFMQSQIFDKYNLQNTSFTTTGHTAKPYFGYRQDLTRQATPTHWSWAIGAGGIQSNITDLSHWLDIIQSDRFLNPALRATYLQQHVNVGYGYGWQFTTDGRIAHDGGTAGYISFVSFNPETGDQVIVLSNRSFEAIDRFGESSNYIRKLVDRSWEVLQGNSIDTLPIPGQLNINPTSYQLENGIQLQIETASDSTLWIQGSGQTPSRIIPGTSLQGSTAREQLMNDVSQLLLKRKHWKLARHCNGEMKFVCYSGLFGVGMKMIRKKTGQVHSVTAYLVEEKYGLFRVVGEKQAADLIAYFDEEGRIKGLFENGYYALDENVPMLAFPTQDGGLLLDGFNIGEPDLLLDFEGDRALLKQAGRVLEGVRIANH